MGRFARKSVHAVLPTHDGGRVLLRVFVLLSVLVIAGALASVAAASCSIARSPASGNWQDEWEAGPDFGGGSTCYNGSRANIQIKGPNVKYSEDSVWTGVIDSSGSAPHVFGQIGYLIDPGPAVSVFEETQWHDSNGWHNTVVPLNFSISVGDNPEFKVTVYGQYMHYFVNGGDYMDKDLTATYSGCDAVQSSEVHNKGDQAAGEPVSHESLTASASLRNSNGNTWVTGNWSLPFVMPSGTDWLKHQVQGTDDVDFWDSCTT